MRKKKKKNRKDTSVEHQNSDMSTFSLDADGLNLDSTEIRRRKNKKKLNKETGKSKTEDNVKDVSLLI